MSSNLTQEVAKVLNKINSNKKIPKSKRTRRRTRGRRSRGVSRGPDGILAGYGSPITSMFSSRSTPDGLIVRGYDLVTSFVLGTNISYYITANPAAWNGTRIAAIAGGFQNYRPLKFRIHYRPQVGSTDERSMFIGTLWQTNYITDRSQLEPSLLTSPGGVYLPSWNDSVSNVNLATCLPQRMFPIRDPHFTTVPFSVIARSSRGGPSSVSTLMPGRIFIEYTYEFRNAIGSGSGFQPSRITRLTVESVGSPSYVGTMATDPAVSGILVDIDYVGNDEELKTQGYPYSDYFPLGGHVDLVPANSSTCYIEINQHRIPISQFKTGEYNNYVLCIYSDNGIP